MDELTAASIHAEALFVECLARFALISFLRDMFFSQFMGSMSERAVLTILAMSSFPISTEFRLILSRKVLFFATV